MGTYVCVCVYMNMHIYVFVHVCVGDRVSCPCSVEWLSGLGLLGVSYPCI